MTERAQVNSQSGSGRSPASVHRIGTPVMGIGLWGLSPLCEIGISRKSVYQMTTSREQARGEGNCGRATERGKEACECMGKRRVCRLPSVRHSLLECILTKSARLRTETSYKAGSVRRVSPTSRMPQKRHHRLSIDLVKGELVQRKSMLLSGEICAAPGSKSSRRLKARNRPVQAGLGNAEVSRGRSTGLPIPMESRKG
jgi:hypothetical protein